MDEVQQLSIFTQTHSRFSVFDRSGQLPFSIAFGLCRGLRNDTDPRPLVLRTARSALDVPYALAHGLLTLHEDGLEKGQDSGVDVSRLSKSEGDVNSTYVVLPSPVNRAKMSKIAASTTYQCHVEAESELASLLEPGKKYMIQLAGPDLGVKWHAYGELDQLVDSEGKTTQLSSQEKLISRARYGHARFTAVSSLPWPPEVTTHARLYSSKVSPTGLHTSESTTFLELSIRNEGGPSISIQRSGRQSYLNPWGPFDPEETIDPTYPRVINTDERYARLSLLITNTDTGVVVYGNTKLPDAPMKNQRPMLSYLVTLNPGEPFVTRIAISKISRRFPDGRYSIRIPPQRIWWCYGTVEEISEEGDNRLPKRLYDTCVPPVTLQVESGIDLQIEDGKCLVEEGNARLSLAAAGT